MNKYLFLFAGLAVGVGLVAVGRASVIGTAFTYQGRLHAHGDPAQGQYDLTFALYDSPEGGRQVAPSVLHSGVEAANGYFTVELDFGPDPSVFNGLPRYLEIAVQLSGSMGPAVLLNPRQKVSIAPYARSAFSAQECRPLEFMPDFVIRMDIPGQSSEYFHHFNWLKSETEIVLYRDGASGITRKIPGRSSVADLELVRFVSENSFLRDWLNRVLEGAQYQKEITIYLLNRQGHAVDGWMLKGAWPYRLYYETDDALATVVEKAALVAQQITRIEIDSVKANASPRSSAYGPVVVLPLSVEIDGEGTQEYDEMAGLGWQVDVVEYLVAEGENIIIRKIPGHKTVMDLKLAREVANADDRMWSWREDIMIGTVNMKSVVVTMFDRDGIEVLSMGLFDGWPAEFAISHDPAKNRMEETVVIAADVLQ